MLFCNRLCPAVVHVLFVAAHSQAMPEAALMVRTAGRPLGNQGTHIHSTPISYNHYHQASFLLYLLR